MSAKKEYYKLNNDLSRELEDVPQPSLIDFEKSLYQFGQNLVALINDPKHQNYPHQVEIDFMGAHVIEQMDMMVEQDRRGTAFENDDLTSYLWQMDDASMLFMAKNAATFTDDALIAHCIPACDVDYQILHFFTDNNDYTLLSAIADTMKQKADQLKI